MQIKEFRNRFLSVLTPIYDAIEAENFFYMLTQEYLSMKRIDVAVNPQRPLTESESAILENALAKLRGHVPIQYILGKAHFYGLEFEVNPDVLIPRPETEELVDWIIKEYEFRGSPRILDIGTGSGCIPVALAANLKSAAVFATDVSEKALETARANARRNSVHVDFILSDILATAALPAKYDVIVSNPPYVRQLERAEMKPNVLDHEPHLALFVENDDALLFYRKIATLALESLESGGRLFFEINQYLGPETVELLENKGFTGIELRKDLSGNDRMIGCRKR